MTEGCAPGECIGRIAFELVVLMSCASGYCGSIFIPNLHILRIRRVDLTGAFLVSFLGNSYVLAVYTKIYNDCLGNFSIV